MASYAVVKVVESEVWRANELAQ